jgi:selenide, water dikinase
LQGIDFPADENLIVGLDRADDAGVYKVSEDLALIQTVDFFTPIVDDPYWFGQIAAANALSDVYAMGGVPKTAMNLVCFPLGELDIKVLRQILLGGLDKLKEAEVVLVGGHSVEDKELKYGLSVTGFIHPSRVLTKKNLVRGDTLILTKPLGTGIVNTAIKGGLASPGLIEKVTELMARLNKTAAQVMEDYEVHACTDITGFGLAGHLAEMVLGSGKSLLVNSAQVPVMPEALEFGSMGMVPAGAHKNREFRECMTRFSPHISPVLRDIFFDPQTSGGLLICCPWAQAQDLLSGLHRRGLTGCAIIGEVMEDPSEKIFVE